MAIAEQFAGLQMDQLIGGPLSAAADASTQLANSTADFINRVGFDDQGNVRNVAFGYQKYTPNEDGTSSLDEMKVSVPVLAIVPIPNLQIDEVNILFDMEVKQSERQESSKDMSASLNASGKIGPFKISVTGSVSSHSSNTRSTDNSAKYHVDVRATNHGTPEGLARVLDMMAANVAPALVSSSIKDGNGQELPEQERAKAERLKELRTEISQIESRLSAAQEGLNGSLTQFKKIAGIQFNAYKRAFTSYVNAQGPDQYEKQIRQKKAEDPNADVSELEQNKTAAEREVARGGVYMEEVSQAWTDFQDGVGELVKLLADSGKDETTVSDVFALKALLISTDNKVAGTEKYNDNDNSTQYKAMKMAQDKAIEDQKNVSSIENELAAKNSEYRDAMSGKKPAALPAQKTPGGGDDTGGGGGES